MCIKFGLKPQHSFSFIYFSWFYRCGGMSSSFYANDSPFFNITNMYIQKQFIMCRQQVINIIYQTAHKPFQEMEISCHVIWSGRKPLQPKTFHILYDVRMTNNYVKFNNMWHTFKTYDMTDQMICPSSKLYLWPHITIVQTKEP